MKEQPTIPPAATIATAGISTPPKPPTAALNTTKLAMRKRRKKILVNLKKRFICVSLFVETIMRSIAYNVTLFLIPIGYMDYLFIHIESGSLNKLCNCASVY